MQRKPLCGVRILDLTNLFTGPYCTMILAALGAEVIQIERPNTGNLMRHNPPFFGPDGLSMERRSDDDISLVMLKRGRNKKSLTLNLKKERGKQIFKDLVRVSDVVIENFSYGVMRRLNLDYECLKAIKKDIVYCSITGFGHDSNYKDKSSYDIVGQAMSGFMAVTGMPDGPPMSAGILLGDALPALFSTIAILAALHHKRATGEGQFLDIAQRDCLTAFIFDDAFDVYDQLEMPKRVGNRSQRLAPYNAYKATDGYVVLGVVTQKDFYNLLKVIGRPDLKDDFRFSNHRLRLQHVDEIDEIVSTWVASKTKAEAVASLTKGSIPCGPVMEVDELKNDPDLRRRKMLLDLIHPTEGSLKGIAGPGLPIKMSSCPISFDDPAPVLGQDNREILSSLLGIDPNKLQQLKKDEVIGC